MSKVSVSIPSAQLKDALHRTGRVIQKSPADIMMAVLIAGNGERVLVSASSPHGDIEVSIKHPTPPFKMAVNAERLAQLVSRIASGPIAFSLPDNPGVGGQVAMRGGGISAKLNLLQAEDFPAFSQPSGECHWCVKADLARIPEVLWAAAPGGHMKPLFQGLTLICAAPDRLSLFCSTGIVACVATEKVEGEVARDGYLTIPVVSAKVAAGLGKAHVSAYTSRLIVETEDGTCMSMPLLQQGEGEPIKMPTPSGPKIEAHCADLSGGLRGCVAMSTGKVCIVDIKETGEGEGACLALSASGAHGEVTESIPVLSQPGGSGLNSHINAQQFISAIGACKADNVTITTPGTPKEPFKLSAPGWETLIMPVNK